MPKSEDDKIHDPNKYLQPVPTWKSEEWYANGFAQIDTPDGPFWEFGMVFRTSDYGKKVFDAISGWNDHKEIDESNKIAISFIIESDHEYSTYIYPGLEGELSHKPIETAILYNSFPNPPTSNFRIFQASYEGAPFLFAAYYIDGTNSIPLIGIKPVWKLHLKIKTRDGLDEGELEYQHNQFTHIRASSRMHPVQKDLQSVMEEFANIVARYKDIDIDSEISTLGGLVDFSTSFYKDVSEIYDSITRTKNIERTPTGFGFNDAAILGLLVRIWKILKEVVVYYEKDNADMIWLLDRQIIEAAVIAKYLLLNDDEVIDDYRKCSYKDRLRMLDESTTSPGFYQTPPGKRLIRSIRKKMEAEDLTVDSFEKQKKNRWRLQGKSFYQIFSEIVPERLYKHLYGIPSESIHGSWNQSMDLNLQRNDDGTFSTYPFYQAVDIRCVSPIIALCHDPYVLWLKRIDAEDQNLLKTLEWTRAVNARLFRAFEEAYASQDAING